jgi:NitT/TauT family transport system ATP-binding protein
MAQGGLLAVEGLEHVYRTRTGTLRAIEHVSLEVEQGEIVSIVGPSGCGKTTLLRCVSGLMPATAGRIRFDGTEVEAVPEGLAIVFQDYSRSLFPWMTVRRNVEFPLKRSPLAGGERRSRVADSLAAVGLEGFDDSYPWQLSGGMQQRVAIARALAYQPRLLLMDEPFASVDAQTRAGLEDLVLSIRDRFDVTILFVTHDIDESVYLGDRVVVLSRAPSCVVRDLVVPLGDSRDQIATRESEAFVRLRTEVARLIRMVSAGDRLDVAHAGQAP